MSVLIGLGGAASVTRLFCILYLFKSCVPVDEFHELNSCSLDLYCLGLLL